MSAPGAWRALVTAGASGIGLAAARELASAGYDVSLCDVDPDAVHRLAGTDPALRTAVCDVSDRAAVEQWVAGAAADLGGVDVLLSNAGIGGPHAPVEELDPADWSRVVEVNLTGTFLVVRAAIPHLRRSASGSRVIMSSLAGRTGYPNRSAYCASKWALVGLTRTLAIELGPAGIRANAVLPGAVAGPRLDAVLDGRAAATGLSRAEVERQALLNQSLQAFVTAEDVARLVRFLASDDARLVSGQSFPIDGDSQSGR